MKSYQDIETHASVAGYEPLKFDIQYHPVSVVTFNLLQAPESYKNVTDVVNTCE